MSQLDTPFVFCQTRSWNFRKKANVDTIDTINDT